MISIHSTTRNNHAHRGPMDGASVGKVPVSPSHPSCPSPVGITGKSYISWSQVSSYQLCPKAFEFKYVLRADPAFVPSSLVFGTAFHDAVARVSQTDLEGAPRPSAEASSCEPPRACR